MTTAKWQDVEPESHPIEPIVLQQDKVDIAALLGDSYPHIVYFEGTPYLSDGHHRVLRAFLLGETRIMARVLRLDA